MLNFRCFSAEFSKFASWKDGQGNRHTYFSSENENECDCQINRSCYSPNHLKNVKCNCDYGASTELQDKITIKSRDLLPLTSFHYSHMMSLPYHYGSIKVGPLVCKGLKKPRPKELKTCEDHRLNGDTSGYYWIEYE